MIDPELDFGAMFGRFDTILLGRKTYEATSSGGGGGMPGVKSYVFSRTLKQADARAPARTIRRRRSRPQGAAGQGHLAVRGGLLFLVSLLELRLVDTIEIMIILSHSACVRRCSPTPQNEPTSAPRAAGLSEDRTVRPEYALV